MHVLTAKEAGAVLGISSMQVEYTSWANLGGVSVASSTVMSMTQVADSCGLPRSYMCEYVDGSHDMTVTHSVT